jgi:maltose alpha-D-glucosyltransferase/alpha-amylase
LVQQLALARVRQTRRMGYLTDAFSLDALPLGIIRALHARAVIPLDQGEVRCLPTDHLDAIELPENPEIRRLSAEQSNSSLIIGGKMVMKLIRRVMAGINPEIEMVRYLTENGYANTPPLLGEVARFGADGEIGHSMIVLQRFVENQGDAWEYTLNYLARYTENIGVGKNETDQLSSYAVFARGMGKRLGELHALLARPSPNDAFNPRPAKAVDTKAWAEGARVQLTAAFETLAAVREWPDKAAEAAARLVLDRRAKILSVLPALAKAGVGSLQTRVHGDFHLGQILVASGDAFIIDFEGEPAKPLEVRRSKTSPLRDVAGLVRSFHYAAAAARLSYATGPAAPGVQNEAALQRFVDKMTGEFLGAYREVELNAEPRWVEDQAAETALLDLFLLEKSAYEICYEAANRPTWLAIPLRGFAEIAMRVLDLTPETLDA